MKLTKLVFVMLFTAIFCQQTFAQDKIKVAVPLDVYNDYLTLVGDRDVLTIENYSGEGARRDTIEIIILQQALDHGGWSGEIEFTTIDSYNRLFAELESGRVDILGTSVWLRDTLDSTGLKTDPTIREGEYVVGFYIVEDRTDLINATLSELQELVAVTNFAWESDMEVYKSLGIKNIVSSSDYEQQIIMMSEGRADFRMSSFKNNPEMSRVVAGIKLIPIQNIKIAFPGSSRTYLVTPGPKGEELLTAINKGLKYLHSKEIVRKAYTEGGFYNARVEDWPLAQDMVHGDGE